MKLFDEWNLEETALWSRYTIQAQYLDSYWGAIRGSPVLCYRR